jgi:hypothetical protein
VTTPDDPTAMEPSDDEATPPARPTRDRGLSLDAVERYLPIIAIAGMVALILIALVWLIATRIASSRRFLGLTLTEALAWDATVQIFLVLILNVFLSAGQPA